MESAVNNKTLKKAINLYDSLIKKESFHRKKWERARKNEIRISHYKKMVKYSNHRFRCSTLLFSLKRNEKFGEVPYFMKCDPKRYKERRLKEKEEGRIKFESNYRVELWFFSESFRADYGTYQCDKCKSQYHHSPSNVYLGVKKEYSNCCGHCVNNMLQHNGQETVYS